MSSKFRYHLFVCQNQRSCGSRPSCGTRGGREVLDALQARLLEEPGLYETVVLTDCGCLGLCFDGPVVVVYPDGIWYRMVTVADVDEMVSSHLARGQPVER